MTNFKNDYMTKDDVRIAKNYLSEIGGKANRHGRERIPPFHLNSQIE